MLWTVTIAEARGVSMEVDLAATVPATKTAAAEEKAAAVSAIVVATGVGGQLLLARHCLL